MTGIFGDLVQVQTQNTGQLSGRTGPPPQHFQNAGFRYSDGRTGCGRKVGNDLGAGVEQPGQRFHVLLSYGLDGGICRGAHRGVEVNDIWANACGQRRDACDVAGRIVETGHQKNLQPDLPRKLATEGLHAGHHALEIQIRMRTVHGLERSIIPSAQRELGHIRVAGSVADLGPIQ